MYASRTRSGAKQPESAPAMLEPVEQTAGGSSSSWQQLICCLVPVATQPIAPRPGRQPNAAYHRNAMAALKAISERPRTFAPLPVKKNDWLAEYQRQASGQPRGTPPISQTARTAEVVNVPQAEEGWLINRGSAAVPASVLEQQFEQGNITKHEIRQLRDLRAIIDRPGSNDFIFALSNSKGLRVLEKNERAPAFDPESFHHQNIFLDTPDLIAAGTLFVKNNMAYLTNLSGHYKPQAHTLEQVSAHLRGLGITPKWFKTKGILNRR